MNTTDNTQPPALTPGEAAHQEYGTINGVAPTIWPLIANKDQWERAAQAAISAHLAQIKGPSAEEIDHPLHRLLNEPCYGRLEAIPELRRIFADDKAAELAARDAVISEREDKILELVELDLANRRKLETLTRERDEARKEVRSFESIDRIRKDALASAQKEADLAKEEANTLRQRLERFTTAGPLKSDWCPCCERGWSAEQVQRALDEKVLSAPSPADVEEEKCDWVHTSFAFPPDGVEVWAADCVNPRCKATRKDGAWMREDGGNRDVVLWAYVSCTAPTIQDSLTVEPEVPTPRVNSCLKLVTGNPDYTSPFVDLARTLERETIALKGLVEEVESSLLLAEVWLCNCTPHIEASAETPLPLPVIRATLAKLKEASA